MVKKLSIVISFLLLPLISMGQNIIAYATVSPNDAYIGQPVRLTVSVYTSTWFTSGIDLGNIKVDDALTVYFRSVSNSKTFSGKTYAGVSFYYNVFPTQEGQITIPGLSIQIESPKPGDYKGIKRTVTTKPKRFNVNAVPLGYNPNNWLVATYLNVNQKWSAPLSNIKVGDVVQRTINRGVGGTMSEFIPATVWDSIAGISIYPKRPKVNTKKSKTSIASSRSETVNYLFEKEGEVIIPSLEYMYWNSNTRKFYKKRIDSVKIHVKPNPDLSMLASIKKSLQKETDELTKAEDKPFLILGLTPKVFVKYVIIGLALLFILIYILRYAIGFIKKTRNQYLRSEAYAFHQVKNAINNQDYFAFSSVSHTWLKKLNPDFESLQDLEKSLNFEELQQAYNQLSTAVFNNKQSTGETYAKFLKTLKVARQYYLKQDMAMQNTTSSNYKWLNPTSTD